MIAFGGMAAVLLQVNAIRTNSREATAQQIYLSYVRLGFENPQFVKPDYEKLRAGPEQELTRYRLYVSLLLYACDEVLENIGGREWDNACAKDVNTHIRLLCEQADAAMFGQYSQRMRTLVTSTIARARASVEECKNRTS